MPEEIIGADVTDIPAPTDEGGAESTSEPVIDPPAEPQPEPAAAPAEEQKDFRSLFRETAEKVAADLADDTTKADPKPAEPDEQIPDDEADEEDPEAAVETADEDADKPSEKPDAAKQPDGRTRKYKEVVEENTQLQEQRARLDTLEKQFEDHGGLDVVETAIQLYEKLATKPAEVLQDLPKHQREQFVKDVFSQALTNENNRVFGVNSVLKSEFGLGADLTQPQMEKVFEYVASRFNEDPADFDAFLDRELEFRNTPERENERLKAELARKNAAPDQQPSDDPAQPVESQDDFSKRMNETFGTFEDAAYESVAVPKFADYGLNVASNDPADIREAKELIQSAVRSYVCENLRSAKAFEPLIPYMVTGDTENKFFGQAKGAFERAMKAKVEMALKTVSKLIGKAQPAVPAATTTKQPGARIPAPGGKATIPAPAQKPAQGGGFRSAFGAARKAAGE